MISSRDRQLGNKINQIINEYNNLSKNIEFLNRNQQSNYNLNKYNYINRDKSYKLPFNNFNLQNRITNSLYGNNKRNINIKKYTPSYTNTLNSNYIINNNLNPSSYNNNIIQDFKTTLMQTQALTNKIMTSTNFYKNKNTYGNNNFNLISNLNNENNISNNSSDNSVYSDDNINISSSINLDELSDDLNNLEEKEINNYKYKYTFKKDNNDNININQNKGIINIKKGEEDKLKLSNQILTKTNQDLRNQNHILEMEIINYKNLDNNLKGKSNISTHFDEKLQSFITSLKNDLKETINKNIQTTDNIISIQKENEKIINKNKQLSNDHTKLAGKIEENKHKKAENQITNEENEKKISNLTKEKNNLNNEIEKIKKDLLNLKNTEKNLKLLNDSNKKEKKTMMNYLIN